MRYFQRYRTPHQDTLWTRGAWLKEACCDVFSFVLLGEKKREQEGERPGRAGGASFTARGLLLGRWGRGRLLPHLFKKRATNMLLSLFHIRVLIMISSGQKIP